MSKRIRLGKKLMAKKLGEEWVFLNLENGVYYGLNETGSQIWDELAKDKTFEAVLESLNRKFDTEHKALEKDLKEFLRTLRREGLIEFESSST